MRLQGGMFCTRTFALAGMLTPLRTDGRRVRHFMREDERQITRQTKLRIRVRPTQRPQTYTHVHLLAD